MKECRECGKPNSEEHHKVFRSECKPMEHCKKNKTYLCAEHHRGTCGVHGKHGQALNIELKLEFQEWLQSEFKEGLYSSGDIQKKLGISVSSTEKLLKTIPHKCYLYAAEDIVRACLGGRLYDQQ